MAKPRHWYKVVTGDCHTGKRGQARPMQTIYLHVTSLDHALAEFRKMPGVPREALPDVTRLGSEDESFLERYIESSGRITLKRARRTYYRFDSRGPERPPV